MFKKQTLNKVWRGISLVVALAMIFSFNGSHILQTVPSVHAAPGYLMGTVTSSVTGALQLSITGNASAGPYVGNSGANQQHLSIDWEPGVRETFDITTSSYFSTIFSGNGNNKSFNTTWTPISHTYTTAGPKTITVKIHHAGWNGNGEGDSSEYVFPVSIPPAALNVKKIVNGGTATSSDFLINVTGTNVSPTSFAGSESGTIVSLDAGSYSISETEEENYVASYGENCSGSISSGQTKICIITNTFVDGSFCGDGDIEGDEVCDDGELNGEPNKCNSLCTGITDPVCGNEVEESSEACDLGEGNGASCNPAYGETCNSCSVSCEGIEETGEYCGDGAQNGGEQCDGTNGVGEHQVCGESDSDNACLLIDLTYCGDGVVQTPNDEGTGGPEDDGNEDCDGSAPEGYLCTASCTFTFSDDNALICGYKFNDVNGDGVWDDDEVGLENWSIFLKTFIDELWETQNEQTTDEDGYYCFDGLSSGEYRIEEEEQDNWFSSLGLYFDKTLGIGEELADVNFGNFQCVDGDEDGYYWPNLEVCGELLDCNDSDSNLNVDCDAACGDGVINQGSEECDGEAGEFGENEGCGDPESEDACQIITLPFCGDFNTDDGEDCDDGVAGSETCTDECTLINNAEEGAICGYKFYDYDQDGLFNNDDIGISGWKIFAGFGENLFSTVTTAEEEIKGRYCFMGLGAGSYNVFEELWSFAGSWATTTNATSTVVIDNNQDSEDYVNFGNILCTDVDEDGFSPVGGYCGVVDCNDEYEFAYPGFELGEICDGFDNDCNGEIDEGDVCGSPQDPEPVCIDNDEDGYYSSDSDEECSPIDCDDSDGSRTTDCSDPIITPPSGGGGGVGGGADLLVIHSEQIDELSDTSVIITWHTNKEASSRVVYGTISFPIVDFPPNYGYDFSTGLFDDVVKVLFHSVTITGLNPDTTYYFRPISAASPEQYGQEVDFTTPSTQTPNPNGGDEESDTTSEDDGDNSSNSGNNSENNQGQSGGNPTGGNQGNSNAGQVLGAKFEELLAQNSDITEEDIEKIADNVNKGNVNPLNQDLDSGLNLFDWWWLILLIIILIILLFYFLNRRNKDNR